jgi:hypothetical protein
VSQTASISPSPAQSEAQLNVTDKYTENSGVWKGVGIGLGHNTAITSQRTCLKLRFKLTLFPICREVMTTIKTDRRGFKSRPI